MCFWFVELIVYILWIEEEKEVVFKYLVFWIRWGCVFGKCDCENCIVKVNGVLDCREWIVVKYYIKN